MTNSNSNILNRPFGLNITIPDRTLRQVKETAIKSVNLFSQVSDYFEDNSKVFSGEVAKEIELYNKMASVMSTTSTLGQPGSIFDTNI